MKRHVLSLMVAMTCVSCSMMSGFWRPPRAPEAEASKVVFSMYTPDSALRIDGTRAHAVDLAMRDFLADGAGTCFDRPESYDIVVWAAEPVGSLDGGESGADAGALASGVTAETLYGTRGLVYVEITLRPGFCEDGGEVVLDDGATYAIDPRTWRIAASRR